MLGGLGRFSPALQPLPQALAHLVQLSVAHDLLLPVLQGLQPLASLWDWGGGGEHLGEHTDVPLTSVGQNEL